MLLSHQGEQAFRESSTRMGVLQRGQGEQAGSICRAACCCFCSGVAMSTSGSGMLCHKSDCAAAHSCQVAIVCNQESLMQGAKSEQAGSSAELAGGQCSRAGQACTAALGLQSDLAALSCGLWLPGLWCLPSWGSLRAETPPPGLHRRLALCSLQAFRLHFLLLTSLLIRWQAALCCMALPDEGLCLAAWACCRA